MENIENRAVIKFFVKKGLTPAEIYSEMVNVLGEGAPSQTVIYNLAAEFQPGPTDSDGSPHSPSSGSFLEGRRNTTQGNEIQKLKNH